MIIPGRQNHRGPPDILRTPPTLLDQSRIHGTRRVPLALLKYRQLTELQGIRQYCKPVYIKYLEIKTAKHNDFVMQLLEISKRKLKMPPKKKSVHLAVHGRVLETSPLSLTGNVSF